MKVKVIIDRPIGYIDRFNNIYTVNYGYVPNVMGGDGEEQDAYILDSSINYPINSYEGNVIAIIVRDDDVETKWIVSNENYTIEGIKEKVDFIERYFKSTIILKV